MSLRERTFSQEETDAFAAASGDFNPIHVDPVEARRLIGGGTLVHGVHALLWALGAALSDKPRGLRLASVDASFRQPIRVGDRVTWSARPLSADTHVGLSVVAEGRDALSAELVVVPDADDGEQASWPKPGRGECRVRSAEEVATAEGALPPACDVTATRALLPSLGLPPTQIANLMAVSRLVGMECPGRHSLLHRVDLRWESGKGGPAALGYRVERFDSRFSSLRMRVESAGLVGRVEAFLRPGPAVQPTATELRARVRPEEFAGVRGLVVGGSRGLGEVTAKLLGVGGADVRVTYRAGRDEALRICHEIREAGGYAQALVFDVLEERAALEGLAGWSPSQVFYFPTPYISLNETTSFSPRLFRLYCGYYVEGLVRTLDAVLARGPEALTVFYPSTTALDEVLPKALEYASAKGAGEVACRHLEKLHPQVRFRVSRLPRVRTDTTASVLPVEAREAADVMLAELRALRQGPP